MGLCYRNSPWQRQGILPFFIELELLMQSHGKFLQKSNTAAGLKEKTFYMDEIADGVKVSFKYLMTVILLSVGVLYTRFLFM